MNTTQQLAAWAGSRIVPSERAISIAKLGVLDTVGVAIAASRSSVAEMVASAFAPGSGDSAVIGSELRVPASAAVAQNATMAHLLDFDDSSSDIGGHPSCVVFPSALAAAEAAGSTGLELLRAYTVGVEAMSALGRALNPHLYDRGWHPTSVLGVFGASVAAGYLLYPGNVQKFESAIGFAAAFASGLKASFGSHAKSVQVGIASAQGFLAAQLAGQGLSSNSGCFEDDFGFLAVYGLDVDSIELDLPTGNDDIWSVCDPGLIVKRHPCCGSTHGPLDIVEDLRGQVDLDLLETVDVWVHPKRRKHVDRPNVERGLEAKFSLQYCVARMLLAGAVSVSDFSDSSLNDERIQDLMKSVRIMDLEGTGDSVEDRYRSCVRLSGEGFVVEKELDCALGRERGRMLESRMILDKFRRCCSECIGEQHAGELESELLELDERPSTQALISLLARAFVRP